ncbi:AlbA family DNA-binding domain-containing protein [Nocardia beijingensis]|uniref:AlbA family DNA-binding domain-containing protein n=1 Tax=Nocardia beijingensis TaxID=95162 RepID=UPI001893A0D8|nr:ATP-binding protein [Nocardia beijingensis]MBF6079260.1 ATP-binding protein [Nocardia beijingensis]
MVFTALHRILGRAPGELTDEMINEAVERGLAETDDLDFKSKLPPAANLSDTDYPKDIAAMANSGGGTIIFGVKDVQKVTTERCDVGVLTEVHERTLRSVAVTAISPPVFGLDIYALGDSGRQAVAIVVPASVDVPHLIYRKEYFGAPFRNDADTVWMKERQIEAMYRARFEQRRHTAEALEKLYAQLTDSQPIAERPWFIAAAHPRLPSVSNRLSRSDATQLFENARTEAKKYDDGAGHPLDSVDRHNPRPGLRSWIAPNAQTSRWTSWQASTASIHDDASVTLAVNVGGVPRGVQGQSAPVHEVDASLVEVAVVDFLALVRVASISRGTKEYEIRVGIAWSGESPLTVYRNDPRGFSGSEHQLSPAGYRPIVSMVDAGADDDDYLAQVYELAKDCLNQVGIESPWGIKSPKRSDEKA